MARKPVVGVVGSDAPNAMQNAFTLGQRIAAEGWIVCSGGRNAGVMKAVNAGAKTVDGSLTIGILPDGQAAVAKDVDVAIVTDMKNARNNVIVQSSRVVVACGVDGPGTASEVALAMKNRKPVILLAASPAALTFFQAIDDPARPCIYLADTPAEAIEIIQREGFC